MKIRPTTMKPEGLEFLEALRKACIDADADAEGLEIQEILSIYANFAGRLMWLAGINGWDLNQIEQLMNINVNEGIKQMMDAHDLGELGSIGAERSIATLRIDTSRLN